MRVINKDKYEYKTKAIFFRTTEQKKVALEKIAKANHRTTADELRKMLDNHIDTYNKENKGK